MDIFSLPDVFLRKVMRTVNIKDRLRLRLTCRAFEELVANTHAGFAGFFDSGHIRRNYVDQLEIVIGVTKFCFSEESEDEFEQFFHMLNRLFSGVSFREFEFIFKDGTFPIALIREFSQKLDIPEMHFLADSQVQLEKMRSHRYDENDRMENESILRVVRNRHRKSSIHLMADFPQNKFFVDLWFLPDYESLLSIPKTEYLKIYEMTKEPTNQAIPADAFMKLVDTHKLLYLVTKPLTISSDDLMKAMQNICADPGKKCVEFRIKCSIINSIVNGYGITETSRCGEQCGEFKIISCAPRQTHENGVFDPARFHFRYGSCTIEIEDFVMNYPEATKVKIRNY